MRQRCWLRASIHPSSHLHKMRSGSCWSGSRTSEEELRWSSSKLILSFFLDSNIITDDVINRCLNYPIGQGLHLAHWWRHVDDVAARFQAQVNPRKSQLGNISRWHLKATTQLLSSHTRAVTQLPSVTSLPLSTKSSRRCSVWIFLIHHVTSCQYSRDVKGFEEVCHWYFEVRRKIDLKMFLLKFQFASGWYEEVNQEEKDLKTSCWEYQCWSCNTETEITFCFFITFLLFNYF